MENQNKQKLNWITHESANLKAALGSAHTVLNGWKLRPVSLDIRKLSMRVYHYWNSSHLQETVWNWKRIVKSRKNPGRSFEKRERKGTESINTSKRYWRNEERRPKSWKVLDSGKDKSLISKWRSKSRKWMLRWLNSFIWLCKYND